MLNKIIPFFKRCLGFSGYISNNTSTPLQQQQQLPSIPLQPAPFHFRPPKRVGTELVRDKSELQKMLKSQDTCISSAATQIHEESNEFGLVAGQVDDTFQNTQNLLNTQSTQILPDVFKAQDISSAPTQVLAENDRFGIAADRVYSPFLNTQNLLNTQHTMILSSQNQTSQNGNSYRFPAVRSEHVPPSIKPSTSDGVFSTQYATNPNLSNPSSQLFGRGNLLQSS